MSNLTINISGQTGDRVADMRKRLAKVLSNLKGDQQVVFTFTAHLKDYNAKP